MLLVFECGLDASWLVTFSFSVTVYEDSDPQAPIVAVEEPKLSRFPYVAAPDPAPMANSPADPARGAARRLCEGGICNISAII